MSPDRADVRWSIQSTSRSEYTLIFVISVSCTAVHVLVRLYTVQVYRYQNTGIRRIHVQSGYRTSVYDRTMMRLAILRDAGIGTEPMTVERPLDGLETVDRALGRWVLICQPICINSVYLVLIIVCNERRSALVSLPYLGLSARGWR